MVKCIKCGNNLLELVETRDIVKYYKCKNNDCNEVFAIASVNGEENAKNKTSE